MEIRWLILPLTLLFAGCGSVEVKTRTETVEVVRPILYCPAVDAEQAARPEVLPIESITADMPPGEVAIRYKATVKQLIDYSNRLELLLQEYSKFSKSYDELKDELNLENNE